MMTQTGSDKRALGHESVFYLSEGCIGENAGSKSLIIFPYDDVWLYMTNIEMLKICNWAAENLLKNSSHLSFLQAPTIYTTAK